MYLKFHISIYPSGIQFCHSASCPVVCTSPIHPMQPFTFHLIDNRKIQLTLHLTFLHILFQLLFFPQYTCQFSPQMITKRHLQTILIDDISFFKIFRNIFTPYFFDCCVNLLLYTLFYHRHFLRLLFQQGNIPPVKNYTIQPLRIIQKNASSHSFLHILILRIFLLSSANRLLLVMMFPHSLAFSSTTHANFRLISKGVFTKQNKSKFRLVAHYRQTCWGLRSPNPSSGCLRSIANVAERGTFFEKEKEYEITLLRHSRKTNRR